MMKAILISIKPKHVANILNGLKTIEVRKKFPKNYVGWVYIYCTKDSNNLLHKNCADIWWVEDKDFQKKNKRLGIEQQPIYNGKVVARFWCDKVETIFAKPDRYKEFYFYDASKLDMEDLLKQSCLEYDELDYYLDANDGYAIHITKLEIFYKPKELNEFKTKLHIKGGCKNCPQNTGFSMPYCATCDFLLPLARAPQSYCFIEV